MQLEIKKIQNLALRAAAYEADCKDDNYGYLNKDEFLIFRKNAVALRNNKKINDADFVQAMGLYTSEQTKNSATPKPAAKQNPVVKTNNGQISSKIGNVSPKGENKPKQVAKVKPAARVNQSQPSLRKKHIDFKYGLINWNYDVYIFKHDDKDIAVRFPKCNAHACSVQSMIGEAYSTIFDQILKFSTKNDPNLTPNEVKQIKAAIQKIPPIDHKEFRYAINTATQMLNKAQDKNSAGGVNVTVKEQLELLNKLVFKDGFKVGAARLETCY